MMPYKDPAVHKAKVLAWRRANPDKVRIINKRSNSREGYKARRSELAKIYSYKKKYGITADEKNWMLVNQDNRCMICNSENPGNQKIGWAIDHDHSTRKIRAILCHPCNLVIGFAKENPAILRMAAKYLEYHH